MGLCDARESFLFGCAVCGSFRGCCWCLCWCHGGCCGDDLRCLGDDLRCLGDDLLCLGDYLLCRLRCLGDDLRCLNWGCDCKFDITKGALWVVRCGDFNIWAN